MFRASDCACSLIGMPYIIASLWLPKTNVLRGYSYNIALVVHDTGSCAACADIDTNVVLDIGMELIARVSGQLSRWCRHCGLCGIVLN